MAGTAFGQGVKTEVVDGSFLVERCPNAPRSAKLRGWKNYTPQPGDIWICSSKNMPTRCFFKLMTGEYCTHAVIVVRDGNSELRVLSAQKGAVVQLFKLEEYFAFGTERIWVRQVAEPLSLESSERLTRFAEAQAGKPYAQFRYLIKLPFVTPIISDVSGELRLDELYAGEEWFCSELVVAAGQVAGLLNERIRPLSTDPGDLFHLKGRSWKRPLEWSKTLILVTEAPY